MCGKKKECTKKIDSNHTCGWCEFKLYQPKSKWWFHSIYRLDICRSSDCISKINEKKNSQILSNDAIYYDKGKLNTYMRY